MHVAFTFLAASNRPRGRWHDRALTLLHGVGVLLLAFIWRHVGAFWAKSDVSP